MKKFIWIIKKYIKGLEMKEFGMKIITTTKING